MRLALVIIQSAFYTCSTLLQIAAIPSFYLEIEYEHHNTI